MLTTFTSTTSKMMIWILLKNTPTTSAYDFYFRFTILIFN
nr:MAG TPA: hypothetical protein [Caudoviricetes sp.]